VLKIKLFFKNSCLKWQENLLKYAFNSLNILLIGGNISGEQIYNI